MDYGIPNDRAIADRKPQHWVQYGIASMVSAGVGTNYECPTARALSNLIGNRWPDHAPRNNGYWVPTRREVRRLFGRDLQMGGIAANGGDLAPASAVMAVAAATRPATVLQAAGATVLEVANVNSLLIPAWSENASGYWIREGEAVTDAGLSITSGTATPHTAAATMTLSRRAALQMDDIEGQVLAELGRIVAGTLEAGFWCGMGNSDGQPLGIENTPDTQTQSWAGARPAYSELVSMADKYFDNGGDPNRMVFFAHPGTLAAMMTSEVASGTGQFVAGFIHGPRSVSVFGVPVFSTKHMTENTVVLCDPSNINLVFWRSPQVSIAKTGGTRSITGETQIVVMNDADVVVNRRHQMVIGR